MRRMTGGAIAMALSLVLGQQVWAACPDWAEGASYKAGDVVAYQNANYTALTAHTAYPGANWNPAATPTLWKAGGSCSGGDPTPPTPPNPPTPPSPPPGTPAPFAKHALVGYWHNFANPSGAAFPLAQVSDDWDVIVVAFADDAGNGNVSFTLDPAAGSAAQFIQDIRAKQAKGKKVVLSLGGQNGSVTLNNAVQAQNFVNSLAAIIGQYGFDGIDLDLESGVSVGAPIISSLVSAVKQLKAKIGPSFYLSMAPEHPYVQGGYVAYGGNWGAYLPIIDGLRDDLSVIHVQYYNNGGLYTPYSTGALPEGSVDMLVGGSKMLIEGFPLGNGASGSFKGLRPDQVAFGVPSGRSSANSGFVTPDTVAKALSCLTALQGCGGVLPAQAYPTFRGAMTWSINWDRHDGYNFSKPVAASLRQLPVAAASKKKAVRATRTAW
ncbi:glycosyl hydrolase family 18 protein [Chromobacterium vaccinii]|uniref:chitinase n=1 Tax=Chromobacterium vaccinii TaxID=1108595 RepID=UPI001E37801D|nr:glycosyl hydrolase family 18 protein [Chromobacterium vaccinii]MCD4484148.1 glycosyl hydrolase family 18 protein [Chromobacterium vaccinii]